MSKRIYLADGELASWFLYKALRIFDFSKGGSKTKNMEEFTQQKASKALRMDFNKLHKNQGRKYLIATWDLARQQ